MGPYLTSTPRSNISSSTSLILRVKRKCNHTACRFASGGTLCRLNEIGRIVVSWVEAHHGR